MDLPPLPRPLTRGSIPPDFKVFEQDAHGKLTIKPGPPEILEEHPDLQKHPTYDPTKEGSENASLRDSLASSVVSSSYKRNLAGQEDYVPVADVVKNDPILNQIDEYDENFDTDLEDDAGPQTNFAKEEKNEHLYLSYQRECKNMNVVPCSILLNRFGLELTKIDLSNRFLGPTPIVALAKALVTNACVNELNISGNAIGWLGSHSVFEMLQDNYFVGTLDLSNNEIPTTVFDTLQASILENPGTLQHLFMKNCSIDDEGIQKLSTIIIDSRFQTLDLSFNLFGRDLNSIKMFANAIEENASINKLNLAGCNLVNLTKRELLKGLTANIFVNDLNLNSCNFGGNEKVAEDLCTLLINNETIEHLDLSQNNFLDSINQLENLAKGLKVNKTLKTLNLSQNSIHSNDPIKDVKISSNKLGILKIVQAIAENPDTVLETVKFDKIYAGLEFQKFMKENEMFNPETGKIKVSTGEVSDKPKAKAAPKINPMVKLKNWLGDNGMTLNSFFVKLDDDDSMTLRGDR